MRLLHSEIHQCSNPSQTAAKHFHCYRRFSNLSNKFLVPHMASSKNYLEKGSQKAMPLISDSQDKKNPTQGPRQGGPQKKPLFSHSLAAPQVHLSLLTSMSIHSFIHLLIHSFNSFHHLVTLMCLVNIKGPTMHQVSCLVLRTCLLEVGTLLGRHDNKVGDREMCISFP